MVIKIIQHNSNEYEQMISLRITQLLEPIGVSSSYIEREKERNDILIGAFENNEIIGCCLLTPGEKDIVQLRQMAVRKDHRRKNIGAAIVGFAEDVARKNNFSILMMHARDPVIEFYKKCGYEISGSRFFEVGVSHHKMQKQL